MRYIDMTNKKIGKLLVLREDSNPPDNRGKYWICQCECGTIKSICGGDLRKKYGGITSCGCSRYDSSTKHGLCNNVPEYNTWKDIKKRCYNKNTPGYKNYGGRGIKVCDRWKDSFENFYNDMGSKPFPEASIERVDNNGNYEPSNCKWASKLEQQRNRTNFNKIKNIEEAEKIRELYKNGNHTHKSISKIYNCSEEVIWHIINNKTWVKI